MYTGELFMMSEADHAMASAGTGADLAPIKQAWEEHVASVMNEATISLPHGWMQEGGKQGVHSEHLGYILTELQFMQRAYPNMEW
jgi:ring-1,2-phenylacetyl-CoA epoxidase subunit PaaC